MVPLLQLIEISTTDLSNGDYNLFSIHILICFFSADKMEYRDLFACEVSIINEVQHKKKLFVGDKCKFDTIKSELLT